MQSTLKVKATDPHDVPAIAPDVIPVTWADKVLADITRDARTIQPESLRRDGQPHAPSSAVAVAAPMVDTTFRATEAGDARPARAKRPRSRWVGQVIMVFTFALVSAFAAGLWRHYGDPAREIIAEWTPLIARMDAAIRGRLLAAGPGCSRRAGRCTCRADRWRRSAGSNVRRHPAAAAPAALTPPPESADLIQSMQRDLAAMGQQIEQLKASIAELKAGQPPAPAVARTTEARPAEIKPPALACAAKSVSGSIAAAGAAATGPAAGAPAAAGSGQRRADAARRSAAAPTCAAPASNGRRRRTGGSPADAAALGQRERIAFLRPP